MTEAARAIKTASPTHHTKRKRNKGGITHTRQPTQQKQTRQTHKTDKTTNKTKTDKTNRQDNKQNKKRQDKTHKDEQGKPNTQRQNEVWWWAVVAL